MSGTKKIAFVYGRPYFNSAKLLYMPFGINVVKLLAEQGNTIDLYLTQNFTEEYKKILPSNVTPIFLDKKKVWSHGSGRGLFYLLNSYFWNLTRTKKYDAVWGIGQAGTVLGGKLANRNKVPFYYLSDEFPDISYLKIWKENEKKYAATAKFFVVPDESRLPVTLQQIPDLKNTPGFTLPNMPLKIDLNNVSSINWHNKLGLSPNKKIVMYAGGITSENQIDYLLTLFPATRNEFVLVLVGKMGNYKKIKDLHSERIIWIEEELPDNDLHSLISQSLCSMCYYADFLDLKYVGKSSGKLMRSLLFGTPVISTKFDSLSFVEENKFGVLIGKPYELIEAIHTIDRDIQKYKASIKENISKYNYEVYWDIMKNSIL